MVVSMEVKLPQALKQWHLYQPDSNSDIKEDLPESSRKKILLDINILSKWMETISLKAKNKYSFMFNLKSISVNKVHSNDMESILGDELTVEYQDSKGSFVFSLDRDFLRNLLGMYFGVDIGKVGGFSFTDMEMVLINSFYEDFFTKFFLETNFLGKDYKVNFHKGKFGTMKYVAANQDFINVHFCIGFSDGVESKMKLFYSQHSADKFIERIVVSKKDDVVLSDNMKRGISTDVTVKFGQAKLTFGEFMNIQRGDVLVLENKIGEMLRFVLADQLTFLTTVGQSEGKYAIKLEEQIDNEQVADTSSSNVSPIFDDNSKEEELLMNSFDKVNLEEEKGVDFVSLLNDETEEEEFDWEKL